MTLPLRFTTTATDVSSMGGTNKYGYKKL